MGFLSHPEASSTSLERGRGSYSASATYVTTEGTIEMAGAIPAAPAAFLLDRSFAKTHTPGANSGSLMCDGSSTDFASVIALGAEAGAGTSSHAGERVLLFKFYRQQIPYDCQSRNHGLLACISSCLRFTAERSLAFIGLVSGTAKMRSSHSISAMVCSASILHTI